MHLSRSRMPAFTLRQHHLLQRLADFILQVRGLRALLIVGQGRVVLKRGDLVLIGFDLHLDTAFVCLLRSRGFGRVCILLAQTLKTRVQVVKRQLPLTQLGAQTHHFLLQLRLPHLLRVEFLLLFIDSRLTRIDLLIELGEGAGAHGR